MSIAYWTTVIMCVMELWAGPAPPALFLIVYHFPMKEQVTICGYLDLADIFLKINKMSLSLQEDNLQCWLPVIKLELTSKNRIFKNLF